MNAHSPPPVVEGWFQPEPPTLVGQRCTACQATVFPPVAWTCPNPACRGDELVPTSLPRMGRVWSWATNHYPPPPPYVPADPYEPLTVVAVELAGEAITVLGQLAPEDNPDGLEIGAPVEVALGELESAGNGERTVFQFRLVSEEHAS